MWPVDANTALMTVEQTNTTQRHTYLLVVHEYSQNTEGISGDTFFPDSFAFLSYPV